MSPITSRTASTNSGGVYHSTSPDQARGAGSPPAPARLSGPRRRLGRAVLLPDGGPRAPWSYPGFPIWIRLTHPKTRETLAKLQIRTFTLRVRHDSVT